VKGCLGEKQERKGRRMLICKPKCEKKGKSPKGGPMPFIAHITVTSMCRPWVNAPLNIITKASGNRGGIFTESRKTVGRYPVGWTLRGRNLSSGSLPLLNRRVPKEATMGSQNKKEVREWPSTRPKKRSRGLHRRGKENFTGGKTAHPNPQSQENPFFFRERGGEAWKERRRHHRT